MVFLQMPGGKKTQAQCETQLDKWSGRRICVGQIGGRRKRMAVRP